MKWLTQLFARRKYQRHYKISSTKSASTLHFYIVTAFPNILDSYFNETVIKRAIDFSYIAIHTLDIRNYIQSKHKKIDDTPYGGGPGMILKAEPILAVISDIKKGIKNNEEILILFTTPGGTELSNVMAEEDIAIYKHIIIICGRYEGIDERVVMALSPRKISIGNYTLTGGELAAAIIIDCYTRRIPGVIGEYDSLEDKRVSSHVMYTKPAEFVYEGKVYGVPDVLREGNHKAIEEWKRNN